MFLIQAGPVGGREGVWWASTLSLFTFCVIQKCLTLWGCFFFPLHSLVSTSQDRSPQVHTSQCIYNTPTWIFTIKIPISTSTSIWTCNSTSSTTVQIQHSQCPSWLHTAQEYFLLICRPCPLLQIKPPCFRAVLEIIVSSVTVGRCQKSGHICCTAQPGSCIWWLLPLQDATYAPNKLFWFLYKQKFSISKFEPFMSFVKVTQSSCSTRIIPPRKNNNAFYNYI